jgi:hypothetical protein
MVIVMMQVISSKKWMQVNVLSCVQEAAMDELNKRWFSEFASAWKKRKRERHSYRHAAYRDKA